MNWTCFIGPKMKRLAGEMESGKIVRQALRLMDQI